MRTFSWARAAWFIAKGRTFRVAAPVAVIVGTVLSAVNQGSAIAAGDVDVPTIARVLANYTIPYLVSSIGYLGAHGGPPAT